MLWGGGWKKYLDHPPIVILNGTALSLQALAQGILLKFARVEINCINIENFVLYMEFNTRYSWNLGLRIPIIKRKLMKKEILQKEIMSAMLSINLIQYLLSLNLNSLL